MGTEQNPLAPDQQAGQGGTEAPASSGGSDFDYERGYSELRPAYTQATQRLSEFQSLFDGLHDSDPEVRAAAMEALGLEPAEDTGSPGTQRQSDEFVDPLEEELERLRGVVDQLQSAREQETTQAEEKRLIELRDEYIGDTIEYIETENKVKFTDREEEALGNLAISMADEDGVPDVVAAYNLLYGEEGVLETNRKRWIESKDAPTPPLGTTIPADQKPKTKQDRIHYIDERMRRLDAQQ